MPHRKSRRRSVWCARVRPIVSAFSIFLSLPLPMLWPPTPLKAATPSSIIIEEIAWAGSSKSLSDEWIELANLGDATSTIAGWIIRGAGASDRDLMLPEDAEIPPYGTYLISNYVETDEKTNLIGPVALATTTVSLSNTQSAIMLFDTNGNLIDQNGDGGASFAGSSNPFASMVRLDATINGDQSSAWTTATSSIGFKQDSVEMGTPGICDLCEKKETRDEGVEIDAQNASSTTETASTSTTATDTDTDSSNATTQQTTYATASLATVSLNEAVSNPTAGSEWIELLFEEGTTSTDRELLLYDSQGKIASIATGTLLTASPYLLVQLASAKLNNTGDALSLRESDGTVVDQTTIPALEKGQSWIKNAEGDGWEITDTITPASENSSYRIPPPTTTTVTKVVTSINESSASLTTATTQASSNATTTAKENAPLTTASLNEIVSNPSSGPEWVELFIPEDATSTNRALILRDSKSAIKTIPAHTSLTLPHYLVIPLSSARLTNAGEAISLTEASGTLIETTNVPKTNKGESWAKTPDDSWKITKTLTPAASNAFSTSEKETESPATSTATIPETTSTKMIVSEKAIETSADDLNEIFSSAAESNATEKSTSSTVKKSTSSKKSDSIIPYAFIDMFNDTANGARVRVSGTVGSVPKLFGASHVFILHNEDGRGVIVYVPAHLHIPPFGSTVRVDGTIAATDYGPQVKMKTTDIWMSVATTTTPQPRTVDLLAPGAEDAWSLVQTSGTVLTVGTSSFTLETEDALTVTVSAPAVAGFRTKRLIKGDTVQVTGLLNIKKQEPTLIIRVPEDVTIRSHAPESLTSPAAASKETDKRFAGWLPLVSAGAAIAATGGVKRLREELKKRKLKKMAKERES
jgi:hypothetical protein